MPQKNTVNSAGTAIEDYWRRSASGIALCHLEQQCLETMDSRLYGQILLQLGNSGPALLDVPFNGLRKRIVLDMSADRPTDVIADMVRLPIATASVNAVYLPHVMEFCGDPHGLLREVDRTLIPDGRLLISMFNPFSLYGLRRLLRPKAIKYPWNGDFISMRRIIDWLQLLGFEVEEVMRLGYRPPLQNQLLFDRFRPMESLGERFWPRLSAVSIVLAVKREIPLSLIRPRWQRERRFVSADGIAEPTTRGDHHPRILS